MEPRPDVSFVVIAYNEARTIPRSLASMSAQDERWSREIVVVDDCSEDRTADLVNAFAADHPGVRLIRLPQNSGRGAARLAGLEAADGDYIAFVDADIVLPPEWLARCFDAIADHDAVGGIAVPDGDTGYIYRRFRLEPKVVPATTTITGNNGLYRRSVFEHARFDPELREGEDVALNHLLRADGARLLTIRDLHVRHEEHKSFQQSLRWLYESGLGASRQLYRYRKLRVPDIVFLGWLLSWPVALAGRRRSRWLRAAPALYLVLAGGAHTWRSFVWRGARRDRIAGAALVDSLMLGAYFVGRLRGTVNLVSKPRDRGGPPV